MQVSSASGPGNIKISASQKIGEPWGEDSNRIISKLLLNIKYHLNQQLVKVITYQTYGVDRDKSGI